MDHEIVLNVLAYYSQKDIAAKSKNRESLLVQLLDTALTFTHANPLGFFSWFSTESFFLSSLLPVYTLRIHTVLVEPFHCHRH